jgi:hypothetical protein
MILNLEIPHIAILLARMIAYPASHLSGKDGINHYTAKNTTSNINCTMKPKRHNYQLLAKRLTVELKEKV